MSPFDIASIIVAVIWIPGSIWYLSSCTGYMKDLRDVCIKEIRQEQTPPIIIEAHEGMTAEQLDALVDEMEVLRDQRASVLAS